MGDLADYGIDTCFCGAEALCHGEIEVSYGRAGSRHEEHHTRDRCWDAEGDFQKDENAP